MPAGRYWTKEEICRLYVYAEDMSQQEAGRRLDRSWQSVAKKAQELGIRWRQGSENYQTIAKRVGCSPATVRRLAQILYPDGVPSYQDGTGRRIVLSYEDAERVTRILEKNLARRQQKVLAGKARHARS